MKKAMTHSNSSSLSVSTDFGPLFLLREEIIARIDVEHLFDTLGLSMKKNRNYYSSTCPIHGGDNPNGFVVYVVGKSGPSFKWRCYTENCNTRYHGDIFGFVQGITKMSFRESVLFLMNMCGMSEDDIDSDFKKEELEARGELNKVCAELEAMGDRDVDLDTRRHPFLNDDFILRSIKRRNLYFKERGFSDEVLDTFEVGHCCCPDSPWVYSKHNARSVIPIRYENFKLAGISGRAETDLIKTGDSKYKILTGSDKENVLYGFHLSQYYVRESGKIIIVEGFADLWKCWMAGIKNVVAVMGKQITDSQRDKIYANATSVFLCLDFDHGKNEENARSIADSMSDFVSVDYDFVSQEKDLGSSSIDEVRCFFEKHRRFV